MTEFIQMYGEFVTNVWKLLVYTIGLAIPLFLAWAVVSILLLKDDEEDDQ